VVVSLALVAALANATASICQRLGVENAPHKGGPSLGLVRYMVQRPVWILGFAIMGAGYACQAVALHLGAINVVQPILVTELVILVLLLWLWYATPIRARDLVAAVATAGGLGVFLFLASPQVGAKTPSPELWLVTGLSVSVVVVVLAVLGSRGPDWRRAMFLGAGASVGFALVAAITKALTDLMLKGWGAVFSTWEIYALCVVGLGSFLLMQSAFQVGPFAASQSTLILVNPFVSIALGHRLFGETLRGGVLYASLEAVALLVMITGVLGLASSPLVARVHEDSPGNYLLSGRGRYARWRQQRSSS
jgi:hypothetical protein